MAKKTNDEGGQEPVDEGGQEPVDEGGQEPVDEGGQEPVDEGGQEPVDEGGQEPVDEGGQEPVVKQAVVDARALRVGNFRGMFRDSGFDNDGRSIGVVSSATEQALRAQFPDAEIDVIEESAPAGE
jgi:hypothetical protein